MNFQAIIGAVQAGRIPIAGTSPEFQARVSEASFRMNRERHSVGVELDKARLLSSIDRSKRMIEAHRALIRHRERAAVISKWARNKLPYPGAPKDVQFCRLMGRLNQRYACLDEHNAKCKKYDEIEHEVELGNP